MHRTSIIPILLLSFVLGLPGAGAGAGEIPAAGPDTAAVPRWWKGNLHAHSLWSDGDGFPEMIADWYKNRGYHFLAISDHNILSQGEKWMELRGVAERAKGEPWRGAGHAPTDAFGEYLRRFGPRWVETRTNAANGQAQVRLKPFEEFRTLVEEAGRFLMLQAEEITHESKNSRAVHMGAIHVLDVFKPIDGATPRDVLAANLRAVEERAARASRPVLVHLNHPNYKWGVTAEDLASVLNERFFEVWNGVDIDNDPGDADHPSTDEIWDVANTLRLAGFHAPPLFAVATDDSHDYQGTKQRARPGRAWIVARTFHLTPESILAALSAGDFHASTGVVLEDVRFDPTARTLSLRIHPEKGETYVTRFIGTRRGVSLHGRPRLNAKGEVLETTLDYRTTTGPQIGEVLREERGTEPSYTFRGDELYVRAMVVSSGEPDVPSTEFEFKRAWTQPVGWSTFQTSPITEPAR